MNWQFTPFMLIPAAGTVASCWTALATWRRRSVPGALALTLFLLGTAEWTFCYSLLVAGADTQTRLFWLAAEYLGVVIVPAAWLLFALQYTNRARLTRFSLLLCIEPLIVLAAVATNHQHNLVWTSTRLDAAESFLSTTLHYGFVWWANLIYSFILVLIGTTLIVQALFASPVRRQQVAVMLFGISVPLIAGLLSYVTLLLDPQGPVVAPVLAILGLERLPHLDLTPFSLIITGLAFGWGVLRLGVLDLRPAARSAIFEQMSDAIFVLDRRTCVVDLNVSARQLIGRPANNVLGQRIAEILPECSQWVEKLPADSPLTTITLTRNDVVRHYSLRTSTFSGEEGSLLALHDVTEQERAADALRRSAQRLTALHRMDLDVLNARSPVAIAHTALQILRQMVPCSRASAVEFDPREGIAHLLAVSTDGESKLPEGATFRLQDYVDMEEGRRGEVRIISDLLSHPSLSPVEKTLLAEGIRTYLVVPLTVENSLIGCLNLGAAITDAFTYEHIDIARELASQLAVALQQARLRQALEHRAEAMTALYLTSLEINAHSELTALLQAIVVRAATLLDLDTAALYELKPDEETLTLTVTHNYPGGAQAAEPPIRLGESVAGRVAHSGHPLAVDDYVHWEGRLRELDGYPFHRVLGVPLQAAGKVIGVLTISDCQKAGSVTEDEIRLASLFADQAAIALENARLYASLQESNQQLQAALQAKEEMIQNVSHELRTPLTHIQGYAELLRNAELGPLTDPQSEALHIVTRQADRLHTMVDRLLILQSFEASRLRPMPVDLTFWLAQAAEVWEVQAASNRITLDLDLATPLPSVQADPSYLGQVVENLLDNALKFSPDGGQIKIAAQEAEHGVMVSVSDQGVGIPPDKLERVFDRFYQVDGGAARRFGGMGIGLTLCRKIVEGHGGRIWAESPGEGQGATLTLCLPTASDAIHLDRSTSDSSPGIPTFQ